MSQLLDPPSQQAARPVPAPARQPTDEPRDRLWTREEYDRLVELGLFQGQRLQLIEGRILHVSPQGPDHSIAIELAERVLRRWFPSGYRIRAQMPFWAADGSDPEPDLAVIAGDDPRAMRDHPSAAVFIVEVSDTTLRLDRAKARLYAASGVTDYWIVNLAARVIEVHREPLPGGGPATGPAYAKTTVLGPDDGIAPLASPTLPVKVAEFLP